MPDNFHLLLQRIFLWMLVGVVSSAIGLVWWQTVVMIITVLAADSIDGQYFKENK